jgi:hypothetical protein
MTRTGWGKRDFRTLISLYNEGYEPDFQRDVRIDKLRCLFLASPEATAAAIIPSLVDYARESVGDELEWEQERHIVVDRFLRRQFGSAKMNVSLLGMSIFLSVRWGSRPGRIRVAAAGCTTGDGGSEFVPERKLVVVGRGT